MKAHLFPFTMRILFGIALMSMLILVLSFISLSRRLPWVPKFGFLDPEPSVNNQPSLWTALTVAEMESVLHFLHEVPNSLNLTWAKQASAFDNFILSTELLLPNKSEALSYLDGMSQAPPRWAHVIIFHGAGPDATLDEYMVGPMINISSISVTSTMEVRPLTYYHTSGRHSSVNLVPDQVSLKTWPYSIAEKISDITQDILGSVINQGGKSNPDGLEISFRDPWLQDGRTLRWCSFQRAGQRGDSRTLLPQGLYMMLDTTTRDPKNWEVQNWFYNGLLYNSTDAFRAAWSSAGFQKTEPNLDGDWTQIQNMYKSGVPERELPAPTSIQPTGPRYRLDRNSQQVSWMGFEFHFAFSPVTGVTLFDVRFRGQRILYELGLQEAMSQYAGSDPIQGAAKYFDTFWGMGATMLELVPGYDCPAYAELAEVSFWSHERKKTLWNAICFFEFTADHPIQRHTTSSHVTISKNTYFVLRTTAVVGNYDYTIDYVFYLDGSMEAKFRASGFIQGAYYVPGQSEEYGFHIQDHFASSLHDHVLNFKADFDILGQNNTFVSLDIEPAKVEYPWAPGNPRNTMHVRPRPVEKETGMNWPSNSASHFVVLNNDATNVWGEKRGYRIMPGSGMGSPSHLTFQGSQALGKAAKWAAKDLWISRQKDSELRSSTPANNFEIDDPMIDFSKFINDEDIVQEDLVVWFNLGSHHLPQSGDLPNTLQHTSASSVVFMPYNFHDSDPSRDSSQGVLLELSDEATTVFPFGHQYSEQTVIEAMHLTPDLHKYQVRRHKVADKVRG